MSAAEPPRILPEPDWTPAAVDTAAVTPPGAVEVWRIPVLAAPAADGLRALLSHGERQRAARFTRSADRLRFVTGRVALRLLLGPRLGRRPADIVFTSNPWGKPQLAAPSPCATPLAFNVAHAGSWVLVALAPGADVGVDVEAEDAVNPEEVADHALSPAELRVWRALPAAERGHAFYLLWVCKEAILKCVGQGLGLAPARVPVAIGRDGRPELAGPAAALFGASRCTLAAFRVGVNHLGAVAVARAPCAVSYLDGRLPGGLDV